MFYFHFSNIVKTEIVQTLQCYFSAVESLQRHAEAYRK